MATTTIPAWNTPIQIEEEGSCFSCPLIQTYTDNLGDWVRTLSHTLFDPILIIFIALVAIWLVLQGIKIFLGELSLVALVKETFFLLLGYTILTSFGNENIKLIYDAAMSIMGGSSSVILSIGVPDSSALEQYDGIAGIVAVGEEGIKWILNGAIEGIDGVSILSLKQILVYLLILLPFGYLLFTFITQVATAVFNMSIVCALSPFLTMALGFGWGRPMFFAGVKTALSSVIILATSSMVISVILFAVSSLQLTENAAANGRVTDPAAAEYLIVICLGWMGAAFMKQAASVANSITGSAFTNDGKDTLTAGMAGTAAIAKAMKFVPVGAAARAAGSLASGNHPASGGAAGAARKFSTFHRSED